MRIQDSRIELIFFLHWNRCQRIDSYDMSHEYLSHLLMIKSYAFRIGTNLWFVAHTVCVVYVRARSFTMNFKTKWNYAKIWIVLVISVRKEINKKRHNKFWFIEIINKPRIIINSDENVCGFKENRCFGCFPFLIFNGFFSCIYPLSDCSLPALFTHTYLATLSRCVDMRGCIVKPKSVVYFHFQLCYSKNEDEN